MPSTAHTAPQIVHVKIKGNRIRARLHALDLSQEQGADLAGLSYRHFNRIILEAVAPSLVTAIRLQTLLGAPIASLWDLEVKTRRAPRKKSAA